MSGLKERIEKAQLQTSPLTFIRTVAARFGLEPPISVLRVASLLKPETWQWETSFATKQKPVVSGSVRMDLESTGAWRFSGAVVDGGSGAGFVLMVTPTFKDSSGGSLVFVELGKLAEKDAVPFSKQGSNLWISRNWDSLRGEGFHFDLHAHSSTSFGDVLEVIALIAGGALFGTAVAECTRQGGWSTESSPEGSTTANCNFK